MSTIRQFRRVRNASFALISVIAGGCVAPDLDDPVGENQSEQDGDRERRSAGAPGRDVSLPEGADGDEQARIAAAEKALQELAGATARALQNKEQRRALCHAMSASPVKEGKLHLATYLMNEGRPLLHAIAEQLGVVEKRVLASLEETGPIEIYMPVPQHRERWECDANVIVAAQIVEESQPFGFALDGADVGLSLLEPPSVPVIAMVPAESFQDDGLPVGRDLVISNETTVLSGQWAGLWINEVHTSQDFEPWIKGKPEFEMLLQHAGTRATIVCAEQDNSVEPYRWDMNGTNYTRPFLIASDTDMPQDTPFVFAMYEDDDKRCVTKTNKDYVKLATDILTNAAGAFEAVATKKWLNGQWIVQLANVILGLKSLINGGDDFVGVAAGTQDIGGSPVQLTLKDHNGNPQGWLMVQRKTDVAH